MGKSLECEIDELFKVATESIREDVARKALERADRIVAVFNGKLNHISAVLDLKFHNARPPKVNGDFS